MFISGYSQKLTLLASAARTASGTSDSQLIDGTVAAAVYLDVTAAATEVGDTLDVYLQRSIDGGTTWRDVISFTQVVGNGGAVDEEALWALQGVTPDNEIGAVNDAGLAAGNVEQGCMIGPLIRVKWVVTDAGDDNASFTFSVIAVLQGAGSGVL